MGGKKAPQKVLAVNTIIIEHLACLEINNLILQPPFRLVSNIQWNDKGISFDGDIEVFSHHVIKKSNFINKVPVQVKGTTIQKTFFQKNNISHPIKKEDIEVYYKNGQGVIYFVVTINPTTYVRQAYYRLLAPLELKALLTQFDVSGKQSRALQFKKLAKGGLENLCIIFLDEVEKQPKHYIETSKNIKFDSYKVNFIDVKKDSFNLFEETAFIYGVLSDNTLMPLEAAKIEVLRGSKTEEVHINNEVFNITYEIIDTEKNYKVIIENTLTIDLDKRKNSGNFHLGRVKTLDSYLKCLQLMKYVSEHNILPFPTLKLEFTSVQQENFQLIEEEIEAYRELLEVCCQIGISESYKFNDDEDLPSLFNAIINIFKNKQYHLLNLHEAKLEDTKILHIELSKNVKVRLVFADNKFINFYSEKAIKTIGGIRPKTDIDKSNGQDNRMPAVLQDNWEDYYWKTSIYVLDEFEELTKDTNFDFWMVKLSFDDKYYDIKNNYTINTSLDFIKNYEKTHEVKYLELALDLNRRYSEMFPEDDIAKLNVYLIRLIQNNELSGEELDDIMDIQERGDKMVCFTCKVILQNKPEAKRLFNSLDDEEKSVMMEFPIFHYYETLK